MALCGPILNPLSAAGLGRPTHPIIHLPTLTVTAAATKPLPNTPQTQRKYDRQATVRHAPPPPPENGSRLAHRPVQTRAFG